MNPSQSMARLQPRAPHKEEPELNNEADIPSDGADYDVDATTVKVDNRDTVPAR